MRKKYTTLMNNNTWTLVDLSSSAMVIDNRWLFKTKEKVDRTLEKHKSRLVA